jgi:hypothetical protein
MSSPTTIKVPRELRDRLATKAHHQGRTMSELIADLLDAAEEQAFWEAVRRDHEQLSATERAERVADGTLMDDLDDLSDDEISRRGGW